MKHLMITLAVVSLAAGCRPDLPPQGKWKGSVSISGGRAIPFTLHLNLDGAQPSGYFLVGSERTPVPVVERNGDSVRLEFAGYDSEMRGAWNGTALTGQYLRFRTDTSSLSFSAVPEEATATMSTRPTAPPSLPLTGTFRTFLESPRGVDSSLTSTFWTQNDSVFGTILDPSGDYGLLGGVQQGNDVRLARFTGWQAILLELALREDRWEGWYYVRDLPAQRIWLRPSISATETLGSSGTTRMRRPRMPFTFEGITPEGDTVRHTDARFRGRVLVLDIMGTWCHNCLDAAPLLQKLHKDYADRGLEIVGLSFEMKDDLEAARRNLRLYRERYGLGFTLLFCGSLAHENVEARLRSQLDNFFAYPTTLFVDRYGRVASIHTGFLGPGTGSLYQTQIQQYYAEVRRLLGTEQRASP
jgi:thiol-disulfide isomerase/thioredoxin